MELDVFNIKGEYTGRSISLNDSIFRTKQNYHIVYLEIKRYLASNRQGTHKTKERSELSGSTRKLHRQKGTGNSRKGDIKNPLFRGGSRIFGPKPRIYKQKLNKNSKVLSKKSILSYKAENNLLKVIEDFSFKSPSTKEFIKILKIFNIYDKKTLFISENIDKILYLSSRNLKYKKIITINELNSYELINNSYIIFLESALNKIQKKLK